MAAKRDDTLAGLRPMMNPRIITSPLLKTYTLEEFWQLPEPPDRLKIELIAGVIYVSPPPDYVHENVVSGLASELVRHLNETNDEGGIYFPRAAIWTNPHTHLEPDLLYVSAELAARLKPNHRNTADLVVEVVLPESAIYDRNTKAETYAALGVRELWLVDEDRCTVEVRRQTGAGTFDEDRTFGRGESVESAVFPTLRLPVESLFAD